MTAKTLDRILRAVANRKRLEIVQLLSDGRPRPVSDIAREINLSFKSTSKHLHRLRQADFVDGEQVRFHVFYRLATSLDGVQRRLLQLIRQTLG